MIVGTISEHNCNYIMIQQSSSNHTLHNHKEGVIGFYRFPRDTSFCTILQEFLLITSDIANPVHFA